MLRENRESIPRKVWFVYHWSFVSKKKIIINILFGSVMFTCNVNTCILFIFSHHISEKDKNINKK